jgi:hypothetical protein
VTTPLSPGQPSGGSTETPEGSPAPGPGVVAVKVPLHLSPVGNRREHPLSRARRTRREVAAVLGALARHTPPPLPAVVLLVRVGWNRLDVDGLVASVKGPIDALAQWFKVDDRDPGLRWQLAQATTRERRYVRDGRGYGRWETACMVRIGVRPWQPSDGSDPLRVLASAPEVT